MTMVGLSRSSPVLVLALSAGCISTEAHVDADAGPGADSGGEAEGYGRLREADPAYSRIDSCEGAPEVEFPAAVCVCDGLSMIGNVDVLRYGDATEALVGVNGKAAFLSNVDIAGTLHAHGGLEADGNGDFARDLVSGGTASWLGDLDIGGDLNVGGDLDGIGNLDVVGRMQVGGVDRSIGNIDSGGADPYVATSPPCPCEPSTFFDVAGAVAAAASTSGIADLTGGMVGNTTMRLETGLYYTSETSFLGNLALVIDGNVDLFVDGSVQGLGNGEFELTPGSTLDIYVAGRLETVGNIWVGGGVPGAVRIYVGGEGGLLLTTGNTEFVASIYAPTADVEYLGNTDIVGAIFARHLDVVGNLKLAYPGLLDGSGPERCPPPDDGPGDNDPDPPGRTTAGETSGTTSNGGGETGEDAYDEPPGSSSSDAAGSESTGGDNPPECPEVNSDCYQIDDKYACLAEPACKWKYSGDYCTWKACGGLDETVCGLDPKCGWGDCTDKCYPE